MSLAPVFFSSENDVNLLLKTHFPREKLTFEGVITHLELRSPMFGETCISKSMSEFEVGFSFYVVFR